MGDCVDARHVGNHVGGTWRPATGGRTRPDVNPADAGDVIADFAESEPVDARVAVEAASAAAPDWRAEGPIARAARLQRAEHLLAERAGLLAGVITREQGKLLREARAEVSRSTELFRFLLGEARRINGVTTPADDDRTFAYTFRAPIGVVGLITPWNFPLAIPLWKAVAALVAGCTVVLKPSPLAPYTVALLAQLFQDAGLPDGVVNVVQGDAPAGAAIVDHPAVAGVSFTGSVPVGRAIQQAGAARLLRTQLELGGNNAVLVLADADLDAAADAVISGAFGQAGQRCSATRRVIVDRRAAGRLLPRLVDRATALRVGPGDDPGADMGPVISRDSLRRCRGAVEDAKARGARVWCGEEPLAEGLPDGNFLRPAILSEVPADSPLVRCEVFGPVLSVLEADGLDQAVDIANSVPYGLSGAVFTRDVGRVFDAVAGLEAGMLHVNRPGVGAYAHLPHVGTKISQYGPPECSPQVWDFYTEWRSVCLSY
jgi:acyl-CoA reductase-like NAD-dependent aldehyde dehydrogenase